MDDVCKNHIHPYPSTKKLSKFISIDIRAKILDIHIYPYPLAKLCDPAASYKKISISMVKARASVNLLHQLRLTQKLKQIVFALT